MKQPALKLYILPVQRGALQRRLFFEGPGTKETDRLFRETAQAIEAGADDAVSFEEFVADTVMRFGLAGFRPVQH